MNLEIITRTDLNELKQQIVTDVVEEVKKMLSGTIEPEYIKSKDVKKMLGCSDSKVESLRKSGELPSYKVQGTVYYRTEDVKKLFKDLQ